MSNRGGKCPRCGAVEGGGYLVVWQRNVSFSAFNGYRRAYSDYSLIHCLACGALWRTKANYVNRLRDASEKERRG